MFLNKFVRTLGYIGTIILTMLQLLLLSFVIVSAIGGIFFFCLCAFDPVRVIWFCMHYTLIAGIATIVLALVFTIYVMSRALGWSKPKPTK